MTRRHQLLVTRFVILAAGCLTACQVDDRQVQLSGPVGEPDGLGAGASESDAGNTTAVVPGVDCSEATCISPGLDTSRPGSNQAAADAGALGNASADTCPGCLIDGSCVAAAAQDLQNACLICDPARIPTLGPPTMKPFVTMARSVRSRTFAWREHAAASRGSAMTGSPATASRPVTRRAMPVRLRPMNVGRMASATRRAAIV
jgi:hypothetical protein